MAFAWEGIALELSDDWAPTAITGKRSAGYVKLGDGSHRAVQIRWQERKGSVDLESRLRAYLKLLDRDSRRQKVPLSYELEESDQGIGYRYQGAFSGRGIASADIDPDRIIFAEISSTRSERLSNQHRKVLATIRPAFDDEREQWTVLGLNLWLPRHCEPIKREFVSGKTRIVWRKYKSQIEGQRWGLADQLMQRHPLEEWAASVTGLKVISSSPDVVHLETRQFLGARSMAVVKHQPERNQLTIIKVNSRWENMRPEESWIG